MIDERTCANCRHCERDDISESLVCGCEYSTLFADWMEEDDVCEKWEGKDE